MTAIRSAATMLMVAGLSMAQAAETTLTLACTGRARMSTDTTDYGNVGRVAMGLVVNLTTRTIHGFREQFNTDGSEAQLKVTEVKETILVLDGQMTDVTTINLSGFMDRMTGDMTVTAIQKPPAAFTKTYTLKCTSAQRMF